MQTTTYYAEYVEKVKYINYFKDLISCTKIKSTQNNSIDKCVTATLLGNIPLIQTAKHNISTYLQETPTVSLTG